MKTLGIPLAVLASASLLDLPAAWAQDANTQAEAEGFFRYLAEDRAYPYQDNSTEFTGGRGNYFLFVFRDINRNGIYDIGDRPLPAIAVRLTKPDGETTTNRSNLNGFAAFPGSVLNDEAVIRHPGAYELEPVVPRGWSLTTGNAKQTLNFRTRPGSIADMVVDRMPDPVGLVQDLYVTGTIAFSGTGEVPDGEIAAAASAPGKPDVDISVALDGSYLTFLAPGDWQLTFEHAESGERAERTIAVRDAPVHVSTITLGADPKPESTGAVTIDFEDITGSNLAELPSGVAGLYWHNMVATDFLFYGGPGYMNNSMSGKFVAYSSGGHPVTLWRDEPFDFAGAYFGVAWPQSQGESLVARAWANGQLVAEDRIRLSALGPVWFDAEYRQVDKIELSTENFWQFVTDDFVVRVP
ncbi:MULTISPECIES: hypothetical protein [unclassified Roseitalea]|uniref:hypothetical protein n=1 Tax=unclassified Roseitalea TaxID=2639107 RepID=UPI00273E77D0|nr:MULTISPECIES: hypothetical protein [unclassified Roseitalea]